MWFSPLLIAPTSLFINALPADSHISSRTSSFDVKAIVFQLLYCTASSGVGPISVPLYRNTCSILPTPLQIVSYTSGTYVNENIDTTKLDCTIFFYIGPVCDGSSIGQIKVGAGNTPGPCVNFNPIPQVFPNPALGANSAKYTCNSIPG